MATPTTAVKPLPDPKARPTRTAIPNRLLAALPPEDYRRIASSLRPVPLAFRQVLQRQGDEISTIYFPNGGVTSITTSMRDGRMVELGTVGTEGIVGITAFLGGDVAIADAMVQVPNGGGLAMPIQVFRAEMERRGPLWDVTSRYSQAFLSFLMQSTACNGLHSVEQRSARWLLMTQDRMGCDEFKLTQEFLAVMLSVRRASVAAVVARLREKKLIRASQRRVRILSREGLEQLSCECYRVVSDQFARLLPEWQPDPKSDC
jgi:CRP-like cAMP-binding protein